MAITTTPTSGSGARVRVQKFGTFLSNMVMPNIGAFIAWGFITALFIEVGWLNLGGKGSPAFKRLRLPRRPGPQPALQRAAFVIGVRLHPLDTGDMAADANLAAQRFPVQHEGCLAAGRGEAEGDRVSR